MGRNEIAELSQKAEPDYFPESRTLDQHIAKLRKKIERDPAAPEIIETVRGTGYRFRACVPDSTLKGMLLWQPSSTSP
ncbi:MAG: helix-turn-helix domain-containing protein [Verrucomicrobiae bacterium]